MKTPAKKIENTHALDTLLGDFWCAFYFSSPKQKIMDNGLSFIFSAEKLRQLAALAESRYVKISMDFACGGLPAIKAIALKEDESEVDLAAANLTPPGGCPYPPGCPEPITTLNNTFNFL